MVRVEFEDVPAAASDTKHINIIMVIRQNRCRVVGVSGVVVGGLGSVV